MVIPTNYDPELREVDTRSNHGLDVSLFVNPRDGSTWIRVFDWQCGAEPTLFDVQRDKALDAFHHPFSYLVER